MKPNINAGTLNLLRCVGSANFWQNNIHSRAVVSVTFFSVLSEMCPQATEILPDPMDHELVFLKQREIFWYSQLSIDSINFEIKVA